MLYIIIALWLDNNLIHHGGIGGSVHVMKQQRLGFMCQNV